MEYTNIQIGAHESDVHMRISDFADVRISDIIRGSRTTLELGSEASTDDIKGDDLEHLIMEDGNYISMDGAESEGFHTIPSESKKIWNVPPPSYIRLITA